MADPKNVGTDEMIYANYIIPALARKSSQPTFHFHHLWGAHTPFKTDGKGNPLPESEETTQTGLFAQSEWVLRSFIKFLNSLKMQNLYDSATIVLMSDHGDQIGLSKGKFSMYQLPLFMVKPPDSQGELNYSAAPFSSTYLPRLLELLRDNPKELKSFIRNLPERRQLSDPPDRIFMIEGTDPNTVKVTQVAIDGTQKPVKLLANQTYTLDRNDPFLPLAVPEHSKNMVLSGGYGIDFFSNGQGSEPGELSFKLDTKKGTVDINITVSSHGNDYKMERLPVPLEIADLNAGKTIYIDEKLNRRGKHQIALHNVSVSKDGNIALSFHSDAPPRSHVIVLHEISVI